MKPDPDRPGPRRRALRMGTCALLVAPLVARPAPDLDVAVPPGSPLDWGRSFPALTPRAGGLFPRTEAGGDEDVPDGRTEAVPRRRRLDPRLSSSFGILRILTWDLAAHLAWIRRAQSAPRAPGTGRSGALPPIPAVGEGLYWVTMAPLLRLMLHPHLVSRDETVAHLVEIGEPALGILEAASAEASLRSVCSDLRERILPEASGNPRIPDSSGSREALLTRFFMEELCRAHPYDPEGDFGGRLFLFGEEAQAIVSRLVESEDAFLRRNAVTALGRYRSRSAAERLMQAATSSGDPVVVVRALSALARHRDAIDGRPLATALRSASDPVLRAAFAGAAGARRRPRRGARAPAHG